MNELHTPEDKLKFIRGFSTNAKYAGNPRRLLDCDYSDEDLLEWLNKESDELDDLIFEDSSDLDVPSRKRIKMVKQYRKKPVGIEAIQWTGENKVEIQLFMNRYLEESSTTRTLTIPTLEGDMVASPGDYIIKGVSGEFYPCKEDIFYQTYEEDKL